MRTTKICLALTMLPSVLLAQASQRARAKAHGVAAVESKHVAASASASAEAEERVPSEFSADGRAKLESMYAGARQHHLPARPMSRRVAEGQAKGASEAAIIASVGRVKANMASAQHAMASAGRHPSDDEVESGAYVMERGITMTQIETVCTHAPSDRPLVVAFDVLAKLAERGVAIDRALVLVQAKLDARASDASIASLAPGAAVEGDARLSVNPGE